MAEKHDADSHRHAGFECTRSAVGANAIANHGVCVEPLWHARPPGCTADMTKVDIADPFARQLMARYLSHRQEDLSNMRAALASDDFDKIKRQRLRPGPNLRAWPGNRKCSNKSRRYRRFRPDKQPGKFRTYAQHFLKTPHIPLKKSGFSPIRRPGTYNQRLYAGTIGVIRSFSAKSLLPDS